MHRSAFENYDRLFRNVNKTARKALRINSRYKVSCGFCNQEHQISRGCCSSGAARACVYVTVSGMRTVLRVCACLRTAMTPSPCRIRMCALQDPPKCRLFVFQYLAFSVAYRSMICPSCGMDFSFDIFRVTYDLSVGDLDVDGT